jgi:glycosyltransferase involved in cell wall biosynthesis
MKVSHLCVNYGTPLFHELFHALNNHETEQSVFYPRTNNQEINSKRSYQVDSPLVLNLLTKISFRRKRRIMQKWYDPLFTANRPDIIHAHTLFSDGSLAYQYHKKYGTPYIVAVRASDMDVFLKYKPWLKAFGKRILDHASNVIFISPSLKRKFLLKYGHQYESRSLVISNGINESFFSGDSLQHNMYHTPVKLLYVGTFLKRKNVPILIRFVETYPANLTVVGGGGNDERKILQMIRKSSRTNFLGRVEDPTTLNKIYRNSDIFIMLSKRETLGLVYLEALSQGLPVIYCKGTGIDGLFNEGEVGICLDSISHDTIETAIKKILSDYQTISRNCMEVSREFNWSTISNKYYHLYTKTLL